MTRYAFPITVTVQLALIVYLLVRYDLYWMLSAMLRTAGAQ